jgi:hypothetical protein
MFYFKALLLGALIPVAVRGTGAPLEDYEDLVEADNHTFAEANLFSDLESRGVFGTFLEVG